jgi:hypothetical protein
MHHLAEIKQVGSRRASRTSRWRVGAVPIHIKEANAFVAKYHRHSLPTVDGKFAVGAVKRGKLVGVAIAGRPVARPLDDGKTLEVNCCSFLYARVARIARLSGTLGSSLTL